MLSVDEVIGRFAGLASIGTGDLTGRARSTGIAALRQECIYHLRFLTPATFQAIGSALGGRGHAAIRELYQSIDARAGGDAELRAHLSRRRRQIISGAGAQDNLILGAIGVLSDQGIADADARMAALVLLRLRPRAAGETRHED